MSHVWLASPRYIISNAMFEIAYEKGMSMKNKAKADVEYYAGAIARQLLMDHSEARLNVINENENQITICVMVPINKDHDVQIVDILRELEKGSDWYWIDIDWGKDGYVVPENEATMLLVRLASDNYYTIRKNRMKTLWGRFIHMFSL